MFNEEYQQIFVKVGAQMFGLLRERSVYDFGRKRIADICEKRFNHLVMTAVSMKAAQEYDLNKEKEQQQQQQQQVN